MKAIFPKILILAATAAAVLSCAQEYDESSESVQKRILEAYVNKYYPDAVQSASGLYILNTEEGTGRIPDDTSYVRVEYTITYLDNSYYAYTSDSIAKQLGTYSNGGYYEPRVWSLRASSPGIVELLTDMREGGSVKAIIPAVLLDEESGTEITDSEGSSKIYEITLVEVIDDIDQYQFDQLSDFAKSHYPAVKDSTTYGFYYHKLRSSSADTALSDGTELQVRYVGRFLNGTVFDTNIEDTAKRHRIYKSGAEYASVAYKYRTDSLQAMSDNSFVAGFNKALYGMTYKDRAVTFFYSDLGYGDNGNSTIPGFVPLFFELWVEEKAD